MKEIELLKIIFKDSSDILEPLNEIGKEIERLQDMDKILRNENINLKLRINKAIEYIERRRNSAYIIKLADGGIELIEILKGDDKE